jgi:SHS family lactate transporter-like MFS transporter
MAAFNFFSHGSQDLFPKIFLALQRHLPHPTIP